MTNSGWNFNQIHGEAQNKIKQNKKKRKKKQVKMTNSGWPLEVCKHWTKKY